MLHSPKSKSTNFSNKRKWHGPWPKTVCPTVPLSNTINPSHGNSIVKEVGLPIISFFPVRVFTGPYYYNYRNWFQIMESCSSHHSILYYMDRIKNCIAFLATEKRKINTQLWLGAWGLGAQGTILKTACVVWPKQHMLEIRQLHSLFFKTLVFYPVDLL